MKILCKCSRPETSLEDVDVDCRYDPVERAWQKIIQAASKFASYLNKGIDFDGMYVEVTLCDRERTRTKARTSWRFEQHLTGQIVIILA